jgi:hypothetical protein
MRAVEQSAAYANLTQFSQDDSDMVLESLLTAGDCSIVFVVMRETAFRLLACIAPRARQI